VPLNWDILEFLSGIKEVSRAANAAVTGGRIIQLSGKSKGEKLLGQASLLSVSSYEFLSCQCQYGAKHAR
jgi:hypothetical protein